MRQETEEFYDVVILHLGYYHHNTITVRFDNYYWRMLLVLLVMLGSTVYCFPMVLEMKLDNNN